MGQDPLFVGVDGGGTSTVALLARASGPAMGLGQSGPSNAKAVGLERARAALDSAIGSAFRAAGLDREPLEVLCLGLAGFDRPEDRRVLESWNAEAGWARRLLLVNDGDLVLAAGTPEGWGVALIAGTGSIAVGQAPDGQKARAGGWGPLMGDEGSAYAFVLDALRLVARRADGREAAPSSPDPLTDRLSQVFGSASPARIVQGLYAPEMDRTRIAAVAPVVLALAETDPVVSGRLVPDAGRSLAELVEAVARKLGLEATEFPLAMAGGFLLSAPALARAVIDHLARSDLRPTISRVPEPVLGALRLAREPRD